MFGFPLSLILYTPHLDEEGFFIAYLYRPSCLIHDHSFFARYSSTPAPKGILGLWTNRQIHDSIKPTK